MTRDTIKDLVAYGFAVAVLLAMLWMLLASGGCFAPCTVNVFSSRMVVVQDSATNAIGQTIEGGANVNSNTTSATVPLR